METIVLISIAVVVLVISLIVFKLTIGKSMEAHAMLLRTPKTKTRTDSTAAPVPDSFILSICKTIGTSLLGLLPNLADKRSLQLLQQANYRTSDHIAIYIGLKGLIVIVCVLSGLIFATQNPLWLIGSVPIALLGWMLPNFFLATRAKARQSRIIHELPTIIDLLIVCAQAGLGLLMCLDKVGKEVGDTCPVIAAELEQLFNDVKVFSKSTGTALSEMSTRAGVDELSNFTSSLIAAESQGSDISYALTQQAEALRDKLKRRKEAEAAKVTVKMVPVIMVFMMPLILCPMVGPAVIILMQTMHQIGGK